MAYNNPNNLFPAITALLLASMLAVASPSLPPAAAEYCSDVMVAFSPCLSYISFPPNNTSSSLSSECCDVFSSDFDNGTADCLCYLVQKPLILGFPLNFTRLFSLSSLCPLMDAGSKGNGSLESLCSGLSTLPPLQGIIGPGITKPHLSDSVNSPPPHSADASPATPSSSTTIPSSPLTPAIISPAARQINRGDWFPLGTIIFLIPIFANLYCHTHH